MQTSDQRLCILAVQILFAASASFLLWVAWGSELPPDVLITVAAIGYAGHAVWSFLSWKRIAGRLVDAYTLFLLALQLFNGGHLVLDLFGLLPHGILDGEFDQITRQQTVTLVFASVVFFHLGALVRARRQVATTEPHSTIQGADVLWVIGVLYLIVGLPASLAVLWGSVRLAASDGYLALYQQQQLTGWGNWLAILAGFATPGVLIVTATSRRRLVITAAWAVTGAIAVLTLFTGARAGAAIALLPMLLVHHRGVKPLRPMFLISLAALALVAFPIIALTRGSSPQDRVRTMMAWRQEMSPVVSLVKEMGTSMQTVAYSLRLVPAERPYDFGAGYARALTTVLPNIFWEKHPFAEVGSYSQWLVWRVDQAAAALGGGLGFSMIAEAYANGGPAGSLAFMLATGVLLAAGVNWTRTRNDNIAVAGEGLMLLALLALPRGESVDIVRPLVWYVLLPLSMVALVRRSSTGKRHPQGRQGWRSKA